MTYLGPPTFKVKMVKKKKIRTFCKRIPNRSIPKVVSVLPKPDDLRSNPLIGIYVEHVVTLNCTGKEAGNALFKSNIIE